MFSLSYLPTAERLTVVIVKARNLKWSHNKDAGGTQLYLFIIYNQSDYKIILVSQKVAVLPICNATY